MVVELIRQSVARPEDNPDLLPGADAGGQAKPLGQIMLRGKM